MKQKKIIGYVLILVGILLLIITVLLDVVIPALGIAGVVIACSGYIWFLIFWRCPFCKKHLPFQGSIGMVNCPYCGEDIDS